MRKAKTVNFKLFEQELEKANKWKEKNRIKSKRIKILNNTIRNKTSSCNYWKKRAKAAEGKIKMLEKEKEGT